MFKTESFTERKTRLYAEYETLVSKKNEVEEGWDNGVYLRFKNPVVTAAHTPLEWRIDFNESRNPFLMERMEMNAACNSGAIEFNGKICVVVRLEGVDR